MLQGIQFAVIITSDRAATGVREDATAPRLKRLIEEHKGCCHPPIIIADNANVLRDRIVTLSERKDVDVILTSGGTGLGSRDITVDVTLSLIEKEVPGFGEEMRRRSMKVTPYGILSRATAGVLNETFILNLPGSPQGAEDCLGWVVTPMSHLVRILKKVDVECPKIPQNQ